MSEWWLALHGLTEPMSGGSTDVTESVGLRLRIDGREWELDSVDGDPVTLVDAGGMSIYADLDGDGEVDHISTVHAAGGFEVWTADPHIAAWGLPGREVAVENGGEGNSESAGGWGLPDFVTPEMGVSDGGGPAPLAAWRCVDRG